jgi:hypothetical protein
MADLQVAPQKQPKYGIIFMDRAFTGLYTQRALLHDPSDVYTARYYGGRPDALITGRNIELTNRLTLQRRPGMVPFRTNPSSGQGASYPTAPDRAFSFQLSDSTIQVIIDTEDSGLLAITSADNASAGTTVYNGTFPGGDQTGGENGYAGLTFIVAGFVTNPGNNGTFTCVSSTLTTLTLSNANGVAETHAATADTAGGVYKDNMDGTATLIYAKSVGAGQMYFISVAGVLYMGDGVDTKKYTPLNTNGTIWNWGIVGPTAPPTVTIQSSGAASTVWQASTVFSTMGLTKDTNSTAQIWQIIGTNADGSNPSDPQFGTTGNGEPTWPTVEGNTVTDGTVTWTNAGVLNDWAANTYFTDLGYFGHSPGPSYAQPGAIAVASASTIYGNYKNSGGLGNTGSVGHEPHFTSAYPGASFFDNNTHWFAIGSYLTPAAMQNMRWKPSHAYTGWQAGGSSASISGTPGFILTGNLPAPPGTPIYLIVPTTGGTSSSGYQPFPPSAGIGFTQGDGQVTWLCLGQAAWQANHAYTKWVSQGLTFGCVYDGTNFQVCTNTTGTGQSGSVAPGTAIATAASITAANAVGANTTYTLGSGSWLHTPATGDQINISGFVTNPAQNNGLFQVVSATSNTITVANPNGISETHSATIALNPWATSYGSTTTDGGVTWTCVGPNVAWAGGQTWNLPTVGFQPPSSSQAYGGSSIDAPNAFVQAVISSGTSGATEPAFATPTSTPPTTSDGTITWQAISAVTSNSIAWSFGLAYAYSYKARPLDDFYSPLPLGGGNVPPGGVALGAPFGSETNAISSASPDYQIVGANTGAVNLISGQYSPDPQVDTIIIWRSADSADGGDNMFELTEIPNIPSQAGISTWSFNDFLPSVSNGTYPGLNVLLPAPIDGVNDPPLSTYLPMAFNFERIWGANGSDVNFSGGPDTNVGNPNEAFLISDELPFLAPVIRLIRTPQGLVTFLTDSIEMIQGGPSTASFFSTTMAPGVGLLSFNACDVFAGEIYFFSADNQFHVITPALNLSSFGFPIGDQLANQPTTGISDANWDPSKVYVAVHQSGVDNCVFICDGSTGWYRLNPHQVPGAAQGPEPIWSPFGEIVGGAKMVQSVEVEPGIKKLLAGGTAPGDNIIARDLTVFTDDGVAYEAYFTMGSIELAKPGQLSILKFFEFDFSGVSFQPTVSYLLNEISGTFTPFVNGVNNVPQFDPPSLYGDEFIPQSYSPNRYYFSSNAGLARCRHLQIMVDFGSTSTNGDEMYSMAIFGRILVET